MYVVSNKSIRIESVHIHILALALPYLVSSHSPPLPILISLPTNNNLTLKLHQPTLFQPLHQHVPDGARGSQHSALAHPGWEGGVVEVEGEG